MWILTSYVAITPWMFAFFLGAMVILPLSYMLFSYLSFVGAGHSFSEYSWTKDSLLVVLDEFYKSIKAYNKEDRTMATIVMWLVFSVLWFIGLPIFIYFCNIIVTRVRKESYDSLGDNDND